MSKSVKRGRNPVARSAILRKGGAHSLSKRKRFQRGNLLLPAALAEWQASNQDETSDDENQGAQMAPFLLARQRLYICLF